MTDTCPLCQATGVELRLSHIIPKFVVRYALRSSPGLLRSLDKPNRRLQDGLKARLLCGDCEQLLSGWEREFAPAVFHRLHEGPTSRHVIRYGPWCMKFAASAVWRALQYFRLRGSVFDELSADQVERLKAAEETWRRFLLGEAANPGPFELHLFMLEAFAEWPNPAGETASSHLNRFVLRTQLVDLLSTTGMSFVLVKMLKVIIIGFIEPPDRRAWKGGKLRVRNGEVGAARRTMAAELWIYLNRQASLQATAMANLSATQRAKIDEVLRDAGPDAGSEDLRAALADLFLAGSARSR